MLRFLNILSIALPIILAIFAFLLSLDSFEEGKTLEAQIFAFLVHNIPSLIILLTLFIAIQKPLMGFIGFLCMGISLLYTSTIRGGQENLVHAILPSLIISLPLLLISLLFLIKWLVMRKQSGSV
ncbi:MAG: hypothetical protein N3G21_03085 [Candidatus Hydrogenedentes bacterium]|nr:hypothetical protein [Candidatus Hydrogenedentota bacterium]